MSKDLRNLFEKERQKSFELPQGHQARFLDRLDAEMPVEKKSQYNFLWIAASFVILLGLGFGLYNSLNGKGPGVEQVVDSEQTEVTPIGLGDLSPDLKKVEQYYTANISLELAQLDVSDENKVIVDEFMSQLQSLNDEYKFLTGELNELGPNDQTITAMIKNLQLRLQLLLKLKNKLNDLKSSKNETVNSQEA